MNETEKQELISELKAKNHYTWLEANLKTFYENLGIGAQYQPGIIGAHGDKAYSARSLFEENGIHFFHGVALYLITYERPYNMEVRMTKDGWVDPFKWIIANKDRFLPFLPSIPEESK
jgi:hypothetical protein